MRLVLFRHGAAEDRYVFHMNSNGAPESQRPLTNAGIESMKFIGKGLFNALDGDIQHIYTSPYTRALQTARLIHEAIPETRRPELEISDLLTPGCSFKTIERWVRNKSGTLILVGHEPDLSWLTQEFCGAKALRTKFSKGGACLIMFENLPDNTNGMLHWMLNSAVLHKLGSQ